jgi:hypothetical protein
MVEAIGTGGRLAPAAAAQACGWLAQACGWLAQACGWLAQACGWLAQACGWLAISAAVLPAALPAAEPPAAPADRDLLADRPVAVWRFEDEAGGKTVRGESLPAEEAAAADTDDLPPVEPVATRIVGDVLFGQPGPQPPRHPGMASANRSAVFGNGRGYLTTASTPSLQFRNGDSITLESWVNLFEIGPGQQAYVIGKGRTGRPGCAAENQNWALRLAGQDGLAAVSFLFRSADNRPGRRDDFHRWTSVEGVEPGTGWHHVAVSYTFGVPDSVRGFIDGQPVDGRWDYGGPTTEPPVVDDDEVWIGSALNGSAGATFPGMLDNVAVHRRILPPARIAARFDVDEGVAAVVAATLEPVPDDAVLFEVIEGVPDGSGFGFTFPEPSERFTGDFFALPALPHRYAPGGLRADRSNPLILRVRGHVVIPPGPQRITLRCRGGMRAFLDGTKVATLGQPGQRTDGHEPMFVPDRAGPAGMRFPQPGDQQATIDVEGDGQRHVLHVEVRVGGRGRRPELGEFSVSLGPPDEVPAVIATSAERVMLTDSGWAGLAVRLDLARVEVETRARRLATAADDPYWDERHAAARAWIAATPEVAVPEPAARARLQDAGRHPIDRFIDARLVALGIEPAPPIGDDAFVRRLSLDVRGVVPNPEEIDAFLADARADRRERLVDTFLADPRWADHWTGYWQDVLAENPNLVNPTLNNSGPFRFFIHEAFLDRMPIDRFATELILMRGSRLYGGPAGFELATENDAPMAAKAHVLGRSFLALEMNCARCHDAPNHRFSQQDLFSLAAMLKREPQDVPASSSIPGGPDRLARLAVAVTLPPGSMVPPVWPFADIVPAEAAADLVRDSGDSRETLAALITSPRNERFSQVIANRLWHRYFGRGLVADLDDWETESASHPELLAWLGRRLAESDYALERLARLILTSDAYARGSLPPGRPAVPKATFAEQAPRRMSAEQVVDSLVAASGKPLDVEVMNIDIDTSRSEKLSLNLGQPSRAWQFVALGNERDRPSLALPFAQHYVTLMEAFGWRGERQNPMSEREIDPTPIQPAILANGVAVKRASQFSDSSGFTALALESQPVERFVERMYLRILGRRPSAGEQAAAVAVLGPGYERRREGADPAALPPAPERPLGVSWSNHLSTEANAAKVRLAEIAQLGDPPTAALAIDWRERAEDFAWTLFNTPEFIFVP